MTLLSWNDPVFVVDLTPEALAECQQELEGALDGSSEPAPEKKAKTSFSHAPLQAVALVFNWDDGPLLIAIEPTQNRQMLDALARLLRIGLLKGIPLSTLALDFGDDDLKRLYFSRELPGFVYGALEAEVWERLPAPFRAILPRPR